jgi:hypothetical protein
MSKRNFILLIIVIFVALAITSVFLFSNNNSGNIPDNGGTNFLSQFNPFSTNGQKPPTNTNTPPTDVSGFVPPTTTPASTAKLVKVSSVPIAGFGVYQKERLVDVPLVVPPPADTNTPAVPAKTTKPTPPATEFAPALRYVARVDGNIYETFADKLAERKFSSTIIPKIYEAYFGNNADTVIMRYLKGDGKTIITFEGNLPKEILGGDTTGDNAVKGVFLSEGIKDLSLSGDGTNIFYLLESGDNVSGTTVNLTTGVKTLIFSSPFTEWLSSFPNNKLVTLTTKAAGSVPGYVYALGTTKSLPTQILGGVNGLTTLPSPNGKFILYADSNLSLSIYNTDTKTSNTMGINTLPEKCVWDSGSDAIYCAVPKSVPGGEYPDSWYQGEISFADQIWKADAATGNATMLADPATAGGEEIDGTKLALDKGANYLFFVNKKDSFLWELSLK